MNRNLVRLAGCQGLLLTNNIIFIAINGLIGLSLAPVAWMATLPVMGYVVGGALSTPLVARSQSAWGRQVSFQIGLGVAVLSALLGAYAVWIQSFWLLVGATVVAGYYNANGQLYRFAAAELTPPESRDKAISLVLAGGLIGAFVGPLIATHTRELTVVPFIGAYLALAVVAVVAMLLMAGIRFPVVPRPAAGSDRGRPLAQIMRQPVFIVSTMGAAFGYGVMNLLMAATPLAMQVCSLPFEDAALVLQWHVIGMYAPGFFTGHLIRRFGSLPIMAVGVLLNALCIAIALSGVELQQFVIALFVLGVGWNFLFTGSTSLALKSWAAEEKDRVQGAINFCVFSVMALTSFASGALLTTQGWQWLNIGSLLPVAVTGLAVAWLLLRERRGQVAVAAQP
ncbi:MFS transporter [Piscinibacter sakaiensis]|uniref:MFS transporter n=1 Tax=Piscinibacter sakaiensis TaxID=1547922 RepID=UPI003AAABD52